MVQANKQNLATVSLLVERWTYSFSLGAQQTRTLSSPIWSLTLLVSMTSNARSGGKPFAHRERPSPVHKVTFKQRRNRTKKKTKQIWQNLLQSFTNEEGDGNEKSVYSDELILRFLLILDPKWDPKQMSVFGLKNIDLDFSKEFLPTT